MGCMSLLTGGEYEIHGRKTFKIEMHGERKSKVDEKPANDSV